MLTDLKLPKRKADGSLDMEWWNSLSREERWEYEVYQEEIPCLNEKKGSPTEIVIKPEALDTSELEESKDDKEDFRPTCFKEYIGQQDAKERIESYIKGCEKFGEVFPHTFLSAPAGCGKTVFANILADILGKKFIKCGAVDIKSPQQLVDKIIECEGGILFIDEFHKISNTVGTFMLPILEERLVAGMKIKPFTCIVATTHKGNLSQNLSALVQRFLPIELEHYNEEELNHIVKQFHDKTYPEIKISEETYKDIASNCKYTPRIAIRLLREYAYIEDIQKVKSNNRIVKKGLTKTDIKILQYLNQENGCGKNSIAKFLNVEPKTYEFEIEPFLIFKQFVGVSSKRKITTLGKLFLEEIK